MKQFYIFWIVIRYVIFTAEKKYIHIFRLDTQMSRNLARHICTVINCQKIIKLTEQLYIEK